MVKTDVIVRLRLKMQNNLALGLKPARRNLPRPVCKRVAKR